MKNISITLLLIFPLFTYGQIINIPSDYPTIQEGIIVSNDGDTVLVDTGTYYENINFKGKAITVASQYLLEKDSVYIYNTIINGSQPGPADSACVVLFGSGEDTTSVLYGFTITGGTGCYWPQHPLFEKMKGGGGIQLINSGAKISHNIITDNHVTNEWEAFGGGIQGADLPEDKMIIVEDNLVYDNTVSGKIWVKGGGITVAFCHTRICNNVVRNNTANGDSITIECASGGIWYSNGLAYVANVDISGNTIMHNKVNTTSTIVDQNWAGGMVVMASGENIRAKVNENIIAGNTVSAPNVSTGHGILINQCDSIEFNDNVIYGNLSNAPSSYGGGICVWNSHPRMSHNLIYNNSATRGGGIYIGQQDQCDVQIINNTIFGNDASTGGALYLRNAISEIINTIVWGNTASTGPGIYQEGSINNTVNYSDIQDGWNGGSGNINSDPLFWDPLSGDFNLTQNSPCINTGDPDSPPDPDGSICDMGVFCYDSLYVKIKDVTHDIQSMRCYPNPSSTKITVELFDNLIINTSLCIYNISGQCLINYQLTNLKTEISISCLPAGIYIVKVWNDREVMVRKVIKQ